MSYPVITTSQAEALNVQVKTISPELFWTCNYEPTEAYAISEDARYLASIQDLYKFAIDSGGLLRRFRFIEDTCPKQLQERARAVVEKVEMLRHAIDHNTSIQNGMIEKARLEEYRIWIRSIVGKDQPESLADFEIMNGELQNLGDELLSVSSDMIRYAKTSEKTPLMVQKWRNEILGWYSAPAHFNIYEGQLINKYIANTVRNRPNIASMPINVLQRKTKAWIKQRPVSLQNRIDDLNSELDRVRSFLPQIDAEKRRMFREKYEPCMMAKIIQLQNDLEPYRVGDRIEFYVFKDNLKSQMERTLEILLSKKQEFSLLPGEFIQEDIARVFNNVPSPDNDF